MAETSPVGAVVGRIGRGNGLSWTEFGCKEFFKEYKEIERLASVIDPETEPFKSKYEAMERLEALQKRAAWYAEQRVDGKGEDTSEPACRINEREVEEAKDMVALIDQRIGALAVDTEEPGLAQRSLHLAIERLQINEDRHAEALQHSYNLLGVIWCNRNEHQKAESYLLEAERIYKCHAPGRSVSSHVASRGPLLPFYVDDLDSCIPGTCGAGQEEVPTMINAKSHGVNPDVATAAEAGRTMPSPTEGVRDDHDGVADTFPDALDGSCLGLPSEIQNIVLGSGPPASSKERAASVETGQSGSLTSSTTQTPPADNAAPHEEVRALDGGNGYSCKGEASAMTPRGSDANWTVKDGKQLYQKMETLYTLTAFYLAQVYERSNETRKSAAYCMMTLNRQLESRDAFECLEWVRNCTQLAEFYTQEGELNHALHCLSAAEAVLAQNGDVSVKSGFCVADAEANIMLARGRVHLRCLGLSRDRAVDQEAAAQEQEDRLAYQGVDGSPRMSSADQVPNGAGHRKPGDAISHQAKPEGQNEKEVVGLEGNTWQEGGVGGSDSSSGQVGLGRTNVNKEEEEEDTERRSCDVVPNFQTLNLSVPSLMDVFGSTDGLVVDYHGAVEQFNEGMKYFKRALGHYILDGFVTDHFFILMDISTIHKYLAYFEKNLKRCSQIHKRRATRLEVLAEQLNPDAYPSIWKRLNAELGAIYREVAERLSEASAPAGNVSAAALQSVTYYERVFDVSEVGKVPDDHHRNLTIAFALARMYQKLHTCSKDMPNLLLKDGEPFVHLKKSLELYRFVVDYGSKYHVDSMEEHIALCKEMAELLPASIDAQAASFRQTRG